MMRSDIQDERRAKAAAEIVEGVRALRQATTSTATTAAGGASDGIEVRPANAYEAVTRQMVEALQEDLREIKGRLNMLLFTIVGGVAIDVVARVLAR
ncbi:MAG: hypothetical protein ACTHMX_09035 [Thermomicrobiales bacterium]